MKHSIYFKTFVCSFFALSLLILCSTAIFGTEREGVVVQGDINDDGKIGLEEAIYALQVTAGLKTLLPHLIKGYELYSWIVEEEWYFTLIYGTNRFKSLEEIISNENIIIPDGSGEVKITVRGVDSIKIVLSKLPTGESVVWRAESEPLSFPDTEIIENIKAHCNLLGLQLHITKL